MDATHLGMPYSVHPPMILPLDTHNSIAADMPAFWVSDDSGNVHNAGVGVDLQRQDLSTDGSGKAKDNPGFN